MMDSVFMSLDELYLVRDMTKQQLDEWLAKLSTTKLCLYKEASQSQEVKMLAIRLNDVVRASPQTPFTHAEYNAWLLRLQKVQEEIDKCLLLRTSKPDC